MKIIKSFLILLLFAWSSSTSFSQQATISLHQQYPSLYYFTAIFNDRFRMNSSHVFSLNDYSLYSKNNVKRVEIRDKADRLCWMAEFDSSGILLHSGSKNNSYFVVNEDIEYSPTARARVTNYFQGDFLVRRDTVITSRLSYTHKDTTINYTQVRKRSYYSGSLLNEQNQYLNEHYLGMPIVYPFDLSMISFSIEGQEPIAYEPPKYFDTLLWTKYDDSTLYFFQENSSTHNAYATLEYGYEDLDFGQIMDHPYISYVHGLRYEQCIEPGACMNEPSYQRENMWCGSSLYSNYYDPSTSYSYSVREDDLYSSLDKNYFAIDTAYVAPPVVEDTNALSVFAISGFDLGYPAQRRVSVPETSILYHFSYEFYEDEKLNWEELLNDVDYSKFLP